MSRSRRLRSHSAATAAAMGWLALAYAALVTYSTLFPLGAWTPPLAGWLHPITQPWPDPASRADVFVNLVAYLPLGLLLTLAWRPRLEAWPALLAGGAMASALSLGLEILQAALPDRVSSSLDWATNSAGALLGAILAQGFDPRLPSARILYAWRHAWFRPGLPANLALGCALLWALTRFAPFALPADYAAGWRGDAISALQLFALGSLLRHIAVKPLGLVFPITALAALSGGAWSVAGLPDVFTFGIWILAALATMLPVPRGMRLAAALAALLTAYALAQLVAGPGATRHAMNWLPFAAQIGTPAGLGDLAATLWQFLAAGLATRWLTPAPRRTMTLRAGAVAIALLALALEWTQQSLPGRQPDMTDALVATLGFALPGLLTRASGLRGWHAALAAGAVLAALMAGLLLAARSTEESPTLARVRLPAPHTLAPVTLPGFRFQHPRLPHPGAEDIVRLREANPEWLRQVKARARLGAGELEAAIVLERIEPGSLDLARLLTRVLATPYRGRGEHARTVALAYDWLYERWEPGQRAALRDKLARGLDHLVGLIRVEQLSPYHARLYGGPLPTLVAANLALYGDDPRGELYMRFTRDLWLNRTLPVWRQIMGRHGGWHESGELLTNGLGRAIYQLPALWLAATGENWFDEPGIRGFCDFLVYQRRPDGTNSPRVPDAIPLALHYRHRPAYNLHPPGRLPAPSVWPWGPLTDAALLEPNADTVLPLARHFDGLGLIVARSDWSPAATRVSFLAGDNYWSQPAPDQGSFSISRGAALTPPAPRRASACQGDSQNLVTVTAPASSRATGQRQVGSGQGGGPAPLDLAAWQAQTGWFHTGRVLLYRDTGDAVVVVADLASAYNDAQSAHGPSARGSRRIQGLRRTFIYDRVADTVIVRDRGASMQSASRQHWLLHGTAKPAIDGRSFRFDMAASSLHGLVLLPRAVRLETSEAADDATTTETRPPCRPAPFWRLTLSAAEAGREHEFLLALVPRGRDEVPLVPRPLAARGVHGIELDTPRGMRRWWFAPQGDSLRLESANQRHDFAVTGTPTGN